MQVDLSLSIPFTLMGMSHTMHVHINIKKNLLYKNGKRLKKVERYGKLRGTTWWKFAPLQKERTQLRRTKHIWSSWIVSLVFHVRTDRLTEATVRTNVRTDGQRSLFEDDDEDAEEKQPDLAFHNSRASKPGDRLILCSSLRVNNWFWGSKIGERVCRVVLYLLRLRRR